MAKNKQNQNFWFWIWFFLCIVFFRKSEKKDKSLLDRHNHSWMLYVFLCVIRIPTITEKETELLHEVQSYN